VLLIANTPSNFAGAVLSAALPRKRGGMVACVGGDIRTKGEVRHGPIRRRWSRGGALSGRLTERMAKYPPRANGDRFRMPGIGLEPGKPIDAAVCQHRCLGLPSLW